MSASTISLLIKDLQRIVIEGNINPHTLLAKELKQLNTSNFTQENKDLKEDILNYLADLKQRVEFYSRYKLEDYFRFTDYGSGFIDFIKPKLVSLYSKVSAPTGEYSDSLTRATIVYVSNDTSIINNKLKTLKAEAIKLEAAKANKQQNTTPTVVANTSVKDLEDWINQWYEAQLKFETFSGTLSNYKSQDQKEIAQQLYDIFASDNFDTNLAKIIKTTELKNNIPLITTNINQYNLFFNLLKDNKVLLTTNNGITNDLYDHDYNYIIKQKELLINISNYYKEESKDKKSDILLPSSIDKSISTTELPTTTAPKDNKKVELNPEQWGIKFTTTRQASSEDIRFLATADKGTVDDNFYMDLLPARQSTIPVQGGRDVPNALPGLNYKLIPQVGKQQIPGFSPVYQNLGIKGMQVTIVGAFTGADGSYYKTDTPEPNSKTPFWSNAKGSPTLSDNPGRGGKLPELTAYNSSAEFKQVVYQGKQIEVEINLFQVYNQSTASQIGQDIKLQSKNGNPKFTGIVRSLDEYHATKERTWYTLVMDVTDFGMASKKPINLNNKLEEAIRNAQAQLEAAQKLEAEKEANPTSEVADAALDQINKSNLSAEDKNKKRKIVEWFAKLSSEAVNSGAFLDPRSNDSIVKQITGKSNFSYVQTIPLTDKTTLVKIAQGCSFAGDLLGKYQAVRDFFNLANVSVLNIASAPTRFIQDLIGAAFFDPSISLAIESNNRNNFTCDSETYFHFTPGDGVIKEYTGNGKIKVKGPYYNDFPTSDTISSLLSKKAQRLTIAEVSRTVAEALGCVVVGTAADVAAGATLGSIFPVAGTAAGGVVFGVKGLFQSAAFCSAGIAPSLYQRYNTVNQPSDVNEDDVVKQLAASFDIWETTKSFGVQYRFSLLTGGLSKAAPNILKKRGGTVKGGASSSDPLDEFNLLKNRSAPINSNQPNLLTRLLNLSDEQVLVGKDVIVKLKTGNGTDIVKVDKVIKISNGSTGNFVIISNGKTYTVNDIVQVPNNVFTQPTVTTTTNSTSANPSTVTSSGTANISRLTKEIDALSISDEIKRYIKSLYPENQRKVLTVINTQKANSTKSFTISREGQSDLLVKPEDAFRLRSSGFVVRKGSVVYDIPYVEVTGSKVLRASSVSNTTNQTTPPPSQSPIPQQQTTSQTTQTQQLGATYYPNGKLNEVNIILGGFPEGLPAKGFRMFNILKNLGYKKQFSLFKKPSIKFKNPNTNEIKTVKAFSFLQGTDNGDSIYIITGNKKGVLVNLIDIISINGID